MFRAVAFSILLCVVSVSFDGRALAAAPATSTAIGDSGVEWAARDGSFDIHNFRFRDGETLPTLHLHYLTLGTPHRDSKGHVDNAVLLLHGTGGTAKSLFAPVFSNELFSPGQPLDIKKYFLIFPDDIGHGQSSKPSDGLHMRFPKYDYDDMVASQHAMLVDGLHVDHLRLILGTSMGCMHTFIWGETFPTFADALAPFACLPVEIAGRNRMMRHLAIDAIKRDPAWSNGDYAVEPNLGLRQACALLFVMGSAPLQLQKDYPTRVAAEARIDSWLDKTVAQTDANDFIYYFDASRHYNPAPQLPAMSVPVLWINSADDFINPPELGLAERMVKSIPHGRFILLPISAATRGHGTHTVAAVWKSHLAAFLEQTRKH